MSNKAGVYKIINLVNNKVYIGSSSRLRQRKHEHLKQLNYDRHCNKHLQNSYNKYGKENFKWEVIEYIEFNEDREILKNNLLEREQYYLDLYQSYKENSGYNLCPTAGSSLGSKQSAETVEKHKKTLENKSKEEKLEIQRKRKKTLENKSEEEKLETRKKLSESLKGRVVSKETREKIGRANKLSLTGKKLSEETKRKISESLKGRVVSKETREKIGAKHRGKKISKELIEKLRRINRGRKLTDEQRKKISDFHKGRIKSEQECLNLSLSKRGQKHHFYGKKLSEEHRNKIAKSGMGRVTSEETKKKISKAKKGHEVSEETRDKIRKSLSRIREQRIKHSVETRGKKVINLTTGEIFNSVTEAANKYNVYPANIRKVCRGFYKTTGGCVWAYV